jgi:CheY-like chemotaxis protein
MIGPTGQPHSERIVLVVDDELVARSIMARVLVDGGFHVAEVHSAFQAVDLLATLEGKVELVVSDIAMPGMSGLELATRMAESWPSIPILLISGQGGPPADYAGAFLPKPFTSDILLDAVSRLVPTQKVERQTTSSP